nr:hypothetical protein [Candidatus Freyrarchaeum guaymaensis]
MVYHVGGLQVGWLPFPLGYVYLALRGEEGDPVVMGFFGFSGCVGDGGGRLEVVAFTCGVVAGGVEARYEGGRCGVRRRPVPEVIAAYLSLLFLDLKVSRWPDFCFVEVDRVDFEGCFSKAYPLVVSSASHEVWADMVKGGNQINGSLPIPGCFTAAPTRYCYVFREGVVLQVLHPTWRG